MEMYPETSGGARYCVGDHFGSFSILSKFQRIIFDTIWCFQDG